MTEQEFGTWFDDYCQRWPAIRRYDGGPTKVRLRTFFVAVRTFDLQVLKIVTSRMMHGKMDPVANEKLSSFGSEIRARCNMIVQEQIDNEENAKLLAGKRPPAWEGDSLQRHLCVAQAIYYLLCELRVSKAFDEMEPEEKLPASVFDGPEVKAAFYLQEMQHGQKSGQQQLFGDQRELHLEVLSSAGLDWDVVQARADEIEREGVKIFQTVE
jgi:hypothetical protein